MRYTTPCIGMAAALTAALLAAGRTATRPTAGLFATPPPATTLAGRLEAGTLPGRSDREPIPGTNLTLIRRFRSTTGGATVVEAALRNGGALAERPRAPVVIGGWTFRLSTANEDARYAPITHSREVWYGSTFWAGPDWTRVGRDWHHPGTNTSAIRRFVAPRSGRVHVTGRVFKADRNGGDGVEALITHRGRTVWRREIAFDDGSGAEPGIALDVRAGDPIRFVVQKRGDIPCDTTHWDPTVTYADGDRHSASAAFDAGAQGAGGWFYEMDTALSDPDRTTIRAFRADGSAQERPITGPVEAVIGAHEGALPVLWLADRDDQSGLAAVVQATGAWRCAVARTTDDRVTLSMLVEASGVIPPGAEVNMGAVVVAPYAGRAVRGAQALDALLRDSPDASGAAERVARAVCQAGVTTPPGRRWPEIGLWWMVAADWAREDSSETGPSACRAAFARHSTGARRLLADLRHKLPAGLVARADRLLTGLEAEAWRATADDPLWRARLHRLRWLKRTIALANPLFPTGPLLFCKRVPPSYSHLVMQYYGWRARPGGGLFLLDRPGASLAERDILGARLGPGSVLEPRLSWDAQRIVFSFVSLRGPEPDPLTLAPDGPDERYFHVYEIGADGKGLRQITRGPYDDILPTWLPDGGIAFSSTRRQGYARCFGPQFSRRWHVYTLHRVERSGSGLRTLSFHDTNEWFPAVANDGRLLYSRWDYIDRDAVTHQNLWSTRPDGTNPAAVWGNATPTPHCTFQIQPIPGSRKIAFTASAHHSVAGGSIALADPGKGVDGQAAITRITPSVPFPEAEGMDVREYYSSPWPLSERYFITSYSPYPLVWEPGANRPDGLGLYLLDAFGNREILYRDPDLGCTSPCPLRPRSTPPALSIARREGDEPGEMALEDVRRGLGPNAPAIRSLRVIQILPKSTPIANVPPVGVAGEENGRIVLGEAPVEADGSARFLAPSRRPLLFQALDADGMAYQTMRTITYLQPGERVSCSGCHESRAESGRARSTPSLALRRPASRLTAGPLEGEPFSYMRVVQPVLEKRCVPCHSGPRPAGGRDLSGQPLNGYTRSYWSLCGDKDFGGAGTNPANAAAALVPRFGARNQIQVTAPGGQYGARGSRLIRMLRAGHAGVALPPDELRRIAMWIDCNAIFFGTTDPAGQAAQMRGERVRPAME